MLWAKVWAQHQTSGRCQGRAAACLVNACGLMLHHTLQPDVLAVKHVSLWRGGCCGPLPFLIFTLRLAVFVQSAVSEREGGCNAG